MKKHRRPVLILASIVFLIILTNYKLHTWLTGWDNLHPEFYFTENIKRSLFAVWQEYQGTGLLGGMGHAAALPRELLLWVSSLIIPAPLIRYAWTFAMLFLGPLGVYFFLRRIIETRTHSPLHSEIGALCGSLFYLFNFATAQMFSVPFEAFITHYAALPWLLFTSYDLLFHFRKRAIVFFAATNIVFATHAYIPTLFAVYLMVLTPLVAAFFFSHRSTMAFKRTLILAAITLCSNAFWLLPFIYFTGTSSDVTINAKINRMSTDQIFLRNKAFGNLWDVVQLKGFWFDTYDFDPEKSLLTPVVEGWKNYITQPFVTATTFSLFSLVLLGAFTTLKNRKAKTIWLPIFFLLGVTMLTTDTQPFSTVNLVLRKLIPILDQAFRFPFTKWSFAAATSYSLLLGLGIAFLLQHLKKQLRILLVAGILSLLTIQGYPFITGHLFYNPMQLDIPKNYFALFDYLNSRPVGRIANFPQYTFWGWTYYRWGYTGSGFPWYGLKHPYLDRAFDVWSNHSENYYWEVSRALYKKDSQELSAVLNKYDIAYILLDESVISASHNRALFVDELIQLMQHNTDYTKTKQFEGITVYERNYPKTTSFVSHYAGTLPTILPSYTWGDQDSGYSTIGDYKTIPITSSQDPFLYFPFRTLFTKRTIEERSISIQKGFNSLSLTATVPPYLQPNRAKINSTQPHLYEISHTETEISATMPITPVFDTDSKKTYEDLSLIACGQRPQGSVTKEFAEGKNHQAIKLESDKQKACVSFLVPDLSHQNGYIVSIDSRHIVGRPLDFSIINQTAKHAELETYLPLNPEWQTTFFILPPLANDGLGYNFYLSNEALGSQKTVNEFGSIRIYEFPYTELMKLSFSNHPEQIKTSTQILPITVSHPNPSYYDISVGELSTNNIQSSTLVLSQAFHPGWKAYEVNSILGKTFPFLFGKPIQNHILINNWANGWELTTHNSQPTTIIIFFLPQLIEWLGFFLLPLPFFLLVRKKV